MDRINALVGRHGRLVAALWLVLLVAAIPLSLHQTDNLTSGGFEVPDRTAPLAKPERKLTGFSQRPEQTDGAFRN